MPKKTYKTNQKSLFLKTAGDFSPASVNGDITIIKDLVIHNLNLIIHSIKIELNATDHSAVSFSGTATTSNGDRSVIAKLIERIDQRNQR